MARVLLVDATIVPANSPFIAQPVGLLSLAAVLRRDGHEVRVHDCKLGLEPLAPLLRDFAPHVVGFRTLSSFVRLLPLLSRMVRSLCPGARLVVGGPHASGNPADALARTSADAAVLGEGEATILELVPALLDGADLSRIPGLALSHHAAGSRLSLPHHAAGAPHPRNGQGIATSELRSDPEHLASAAAPLSAPSSATILLRPSYFAKASKDKSGFEGQVDHRPSTIFLTPPRTPIADLDSLPPPAWDLLPVETYFRRNRAGTSRTGRSMTVFTSRGCPYGCAFCHNLFGRRFRARSPESVLDEISFLTRRYGADEFELHDDAFNTDRSRMHTICDGLQQAGSPANLAFPNGLRADRLDRDDLVRLRGAGTHHIALSPETASPRLQDYLGKRMDLDRLLDAARICDELRIFTVGYFMLGFPTETEEEMRSTVEFACRSPLHTASFFTVIPFPGSRIWTEARASGRLPHSWTADCYHDTTINLSEVPDERFRQIWLEAYRRFYLSPRRALGILRNTPNLRTLMRNSGFVLARFLG